MEFGMLHLFENPIGKTEGEVIKEQMELMMAAESLGFDSTWPAEHHFSEYGFCASPQLTLAALATKTKRIKLGTGVVVLPFHHPIRVAEDFAFLDHLSDGRVILGLGRGYQPGEYRGFGVDQERSREIFQEGVSIIRQAWTQDRVNFQGKHYRVDDLEVRPHPYQKPTPPMYCAVLSPESFTAAGEPVVVADHDGGVRIAPDREVGAAVARVVEAARAEARDQRLALALALQVVVGIGAERAREQAQVRGDGFHVAAMAGADQPELATLRVLGAQPVEHRLVVGQGGRIDRAARGDLALDAGAAGCEPADHARQRQRVADQVAGQQFREQVGAQQRVVEVDDERFHGPGG